VGVFWLGEPVLAYRTQVAGVPGARAARFADNERAADDDESRDGEQHGCDTAAEPTARTRGVTHLPRSPRLYVIQLATRRARFHVARGRAIEQPDALVRAS